MVSGAVAGASSELKDMIVELRATSSRSPRPTSSSATAESALSASPTVISLLAEIALTAYMFRLDLPPDVPSGLAAQSTYDHPLTTLPSADRSDLGIFYPFVGHAWHIAVIEVDVETGKLELLRYAAVHDAGTIVNPRTLDGQVIGGTVQGLGTALYEEILYDDLGRVRNASFEHDHLPSSMDVPTMTVGHQETPSPYTAYGIKGAGEGGRMLTPAIMSAAIEDALSPYGVTVKSLPISAEQIVEWASSGRRLTQPRDRVCPGWTCPLSDAAVVDRLRACRVVPVATIEEPARAPEVGAALLAGGIGCIEITFRHAGAAEAIRLAREVDGLLVGAGTVLSTEQARAAHDAGASFAVAPGTNEEVVRACDELACRSFPVSRRLRRSSGRASLGVMWSRCSRPRRSAGPRSSVPSPRPTRMSASFRPEVSTRRTWATISPFPRSSRAAGAGSCGPSSSARGASTRSSASPAR